MGDLVFDAVNGYYDSNLNACQPQFELYGVITSSFIDFSLSLITMLLFLRPLCKLRQAHEAHIEKNETSEQEYTTETSAGSANVSTNDVTSGVLTNIHIIQPQTSQKSIPIDNSNGIFRIHVENDGKDIDQTSIPSPLSPVCINSPTTESKSLPFRSIAGIRVERITNMIIDEDVATDVPIDVPLSPYSNLEMAHKMTFNSETSPIENKNQITSAEKMEVRRMETITFTATAGATITRNTANTISENNGISEVQNMEQDQDETSLKKRKRKKKKKKGDGSLDELIIRYALLVSIAIISTLILHVLSLLASWVTDLSTIDDAINVWCIVLINKVNNKVYKKLCCCCNNMIKTCV